MCVYVFVVPPARLIHFDTAQFYATSLDFIVILCCNDLVGQQLVSLLLKYSSCFILSVVGKKFGKGHVGF